LAVGSIVWERKKFNARKGKIIGHASGPLDIGDDRRGQWRVRWDDNAEEDKTTHQLQKSAPNSLQQSSKSKGSKATGNKRQASTSSSSLRNSSNSSSVGSDDESEGGGNNNDNDNDEGGNDNDDEDFIDFGGGGGFSDDNDERDNINDLAESSIEVDIENYVGAAANVDSNSDDENSCHDEPDPDQDVEEEDVQLGEYQEGDRVMDESAIVDLDEARRNSRQKKYEEEKEKLISEGFEIIKTYNPSKAMDIGARVQTRRKDPVTKRPRKGVITHKVYTEEGKYSWSVRLESGEDELFVSQQLKRDDGGGGNEIYMWKVVRDHFPDPGKEPEEYENCGMVGYNYEKLDEDLDTESSEYGYPFAELFTKMWPGSSKRQLGNMNGKVRESNERFNKRVKEFTEEEWWHGIGIILVAGPTGYGGVEKMFNKMRGQRRHKNLPGVVKRDPVSVMSRGRFEEYKKFFSYAFEGNKPDDPWNRIMGLVDGFNYNRKINVAASMKKVLDESMSAFQPRSTPNGGLPHFSFIKRKPRPYGIEFKVLVCGVTSKLFLHFIIHKLQYNMYSLCFVIQSTEIMLYLEIQRGKVAMNGAKYGKYADAIGPTAACVKRIIEATAYCGNKDEERRDAAEEGKTEFYNADAWFAGVRAARAANELGHEFFGPVKTNHGGFPLLELQKLMKDWPSGSYLVLECKEHRLFAVGYKYSLRSKGK